MMPPMTSNICRHTNGFPEHVGSVTDCIGCDASQLINCVIRSYSTNTYTCAAMLTSSVSMGCGRTVVTSLETLAANDIGRSTSRVVRPLIVNANGNQIRPHELDCPGLATTCRIL